MSATLEETKPPGIPRKRRPFRAVLFGLLGFLLLIAMGGAAGYGAGIGARKSAESGIVQRQLSEQYQFALVDIEFGRYEAARQRLEFIIDHDPGYPGAREKLTEVLVLAVVPTAIPSATVTVTPDSSGAESSYQRAVQLIQAQDWAGALTAIDQVRKLDPAYKAAQIDGMYYFTLRNQGVALIGQGNLEGGIYYLTLAERFGTLDNVGYQLRDNARYYVNAASFWELDWKLAAEYFGQLAGSGLWDGTMTANERYLFAAMRYGDDLFEDELYCQAYEQYENASRIGNLDERAARNFVQARQLCFPATEAPPAATTAAPTSETPATEAPTTEPPPTEPPPTEVPTQPPT
jgi:hypothetical protein